MLLLNPFLVWFYLVQHPPFYIPRPTRLLHHIRKENTPAIAVMLVNNYSSAFEKRSKHSIQILPPNICFRPLVNIHVFELFLALLPAFVHLFDAASNVLLVLWLMAFLIPIALEIFVHTKRFTNALRVESHWVGTVHAPHQNQQKTHDLQWKQHLYTTVQPYYRYSGMCLI